MSFLRYGFKFLYDCICGVCTTCKKKAALTTKSNLELAAENSKSEISILPKQIQQAPLPPPSVQFILSSTLFSQSNKTKTREVINTGKNRILEQLYKQYQLNSRRCVVLIDDDPRNIRPALEKFSAIQVSRSKNHFTQAMQYIQSPEKRQKLFNKVCEDFYMYTDKISDEKMVFAIDLDDTVINSKTEKFLDEVGFLRFVELAKQRNIPWHIVTARPEVGLDGKPNDNRRWVKGLFTKLCNFETEFNFDEHLHFTGLYEPPDPITPPCSPLPLNQI